MDFINFDAHQLSAVQRVYPFARNARPNSQPKAVRSSSYT